MNRIPAGLAGIIGKKSNRKNIKWQCETLLKMIIPLRQRWYIPIEVFSACILTGGVLLS